MPKFYVRGHSIEITENKSSGKIDYELDIATDLDSEDLEDRIIKYLLDEGFFDLIREDKSL